MEICVLVRIIVICVHEWIYHCGFVSSLVIAWFVCKLLLNLLIKIFEKLSASLLRNGLVGDRLWNIACRVFIKALYYTKIDYFTSVTGKLIVCIPVFVIVRDREV